MAITYPLPPWPRFLLSAGLGISNILLVLNLFDKLGAGSIYILLPAIALTLIHHVTYFILSLRKHGPALLPTPRQRQSVYRSPTTQRNSDAVEDPEAALGMSTVSTGEETTHRHLATPTPSNASNTRPLITSATLSYPPYLTHAATPTLACLLALLWIGVAWIPFFVALEGRLALRLTEGVLCIILSGLLWAFFGICVRQRQSMLKRQDFIRMAN